MWISNKRLDHGNERDGVHPVVLARCIDESEHRHSWLLILIGHWWIGSHLVSDALMWKCPNQQAGIGEDDGKKMRRTGVAMHSLVCQHVKLTFQLAALLLDAGHQTDDSSSKVTSANHEDGHGADIRRRDRSCGSRRALLPCGFLLFLVQRQFGIHLKSLEGVLPAFRRDMGLGKDGRDDRTVEAVLRLRLVAWRCEPGKRCSA